MTGTMRSSVSALQGFCLGAAASLAAITLNPGQVEAYVVTVGGVKYDVTTFTGTYNDNASKFGAPANGGMMPWWNNSSLASNFATAVAGGFGSPNPPTLGPFFAFVCSASAPDCTDEIYSQAWNGTSSSFNTAGVTRSRVYAIATYIPTPGPLPLLGAGAAFGFSRRLRKRIQTTRQPLASQALRA